MVRFVLSILITFSFIPAIAQMTVGGWRIYDSFTGVDRIIQTPEKIYYVSSGTLFCYDFSNDENIVFSRENGLNGNSVDKIFYNPDGKYLFVAYSDGNIDLISDKDGKITNMSDIRDSDIRFSKKINSVSFDSGKIYVSASFGVVIFNEKNFKVEESGVYGKSVDVFCKTGNYYLMGVDHGFYFLPVEKKISSLGDFKYIFYSDCVSLMPVGSNEALGISRNDRGNILFRYKFDFLKGECKIKEVVAGVDSYYIDRIQNGFNIPARSRFILLDADGNLVFDRNISRNGDSFVSLWKTDEGWLAGKNGITPCRITEMGNVEPAGSTITPSGIGIKSVDILEFDTEGRLYLSSRSYTRLFHSDNDMPTPVGRLFEGKYENLEPDTLKSPLNSTTSLSISPTHPGKFYLGNYRCGVIAMDGNKIESIYDNSNSPMVKWWGCSGEGVEVDDYGNLWVVAGYEVSPSLMCLPAEYVGKENAGKADWIPFPLDGIKVTLDGSVLVCKHSNVVVMYSSGYGEGVVFIDTKSTLNPSDDSFTQVSSFTDSDGISFNVNYIYSCVEDSGGNLWFGTDNGIFVVTDPSMTANDPLTPVIRPKVPRNDGTLLADYLLVGNSVLDIKFDSAGNGWAGTANGLFCFTPDGKKIKEHLTTDNSPLPVNEIRSVAPSPSGNSLFIGTSMGLAEYGTGSSAPMPDYSEVTVYPNPVRPEWGGPVTIKGLVDNSLIKITDSAGHIVFTTLSEGGLALWNLNDISGKRPVSGVYYIFASPRNNLSGGVEGELVAKIMIIN